LSSDSEEREIAYAGNSNKVLDSWPKDVREMVKTNLQALQSSRVSGFSDLPDWGGSGKLTDKELNGKKFEGSRQLTIKDKNSYRVAYIAEFEGFVVVLHCFTKQKEGRQNKDLNTVVERLKHARDRFDNK